MNRPVEWCESSEELCWAAAGASAICITGGAGEGVAAGL